MWIEIAKDAFASKDTKGFYFVLNLLTWSPANSVSRYNVYVDSRDVMDTENYKNLSRQDKELLDDEFAAFVTTNGKIIYRISEEKYAGDTTYNIEEAIRFFIQPASIILENSKNDASFVRAVIYHFDQPIATGQRVLSEYIQNGWIQFENAGGCLNVENFIEGKLQSFNELALKNGADNHKYIRCMVLLDSDKEYPTQEQKPQYARLVKYLTEKQINNFHILEKRMMENYMPDEVIEKINGQSLKAWIDVYKTLSNEQKDFLNYKSGFPKETDEKGVRKPIKTEIHALYDIDNTNFDILDKGLKFPNFKDAFPGLFESDALVNKHTLKARANSDELERIIVKVRKLI